MPERRKHIRINESFRVVYQIVKSFRMVASHSQDASEGGICIPVLQHLEPKMVLDLEMYIEESEKPIKAVGEVVWIRESKDLKFPFLSGIKFVKIIPEAARQLRNYLREKAEEKHLKWIDE